MAMSWPEGKWMNSSDGVSGIDWTRQHSMIAWVSCSFTKNKRHFNSLGTASGWENGWDILPSQDFRQWFTCTGHNFWVQNRVVVLETYPTYVYIVYIWLHMYTYVTYVYICYIAIATETKATSYYPFPRPFIHGEFSWQCAERGSATPTLDCGNGRSRRLGFGEGSTWKHLEEYHTILNMHIPY